MPELIPIYKTKFAHSLMDHQMAQLAILLTGDPDRATLMSAEIRDVYQYKVLESRIAGLGISVHLSVKVFIFLLSQSLGDVSIYVHSLWHMAREPDQTGKQITMYKFLESFGDGFPTDEAMNDFWDSQKDEDHLNIIDHKATYQEPVRVAVIL